MPMAPLPHGELTGKRALILAAPDFEDSELLYPYLRLLEAGVEVKIAGLGARAYRGKHGLSIDVDANVEDVVVGHWDLIVIPGGWAPDALRMSDAVLNLVRRAVAANNCVAAICHGGWVLASAGVLAGRQATGYRAIKDDIIHAGAHWVDAPVVEDGPLLTSRTPADLPAFGRALVQRLAAPVPQPTASV